MRWSVLVVVGDPGLCRRIDTALTARGLIVATAGTLTRANDMMVEYTPSVLILDIVLPDGDGVAFCTALRADGWRMPIILLGPSPDEDDVVRGFAAGADDYLVKPFGMGELKARVNGQLRHAGRPRPASRLHLAA